MCSNVASLLVSGGIGVLGAVVGSIVGARVTHKLLLLREYRSACGKFHAAFAPVLDSLRESRSEPNLIRNSIAAQEGAIAEFRMYLTGERRNQFNPAYEQYRQCRRPVEWDEGVGGAKPDARPNLIKAIENLLAFADESPDGS
jgi:hypothetical protein